MSLSRVSCAGERSVHRLYGRRDRRPLSVSRARLVRHKLPCLRIPPGRSLLFPPALFPVFPRSVWLEVGFGAAEHLLWQARSHPDIGLLGIEPFAGGVAKAVSGIVSEGLLNVRLYDGDARDLFPRFPNCSFSRIFVLFPDPWPKARHEKRRFFSPEVVDELARLLVPSGELRVASDIPGYVDFVLRRVCCHSAFSWSANCAWDWRCRSPDWPMTRYESKGLLAGRLPVYLRFLRL